MASETTLKSRLVATWRDIYKNDMVLRHENRFGKGMPDISATAFKRTIWIEGKFWRIGKKTASDADLRSLQHLNMRNFARAGMAFYLIWRERQGDTVVVSPSRYGDVGGTKHVPEDAHLVIPYQTPRIVATVLRDMLESCDASLPYARQRLMREHNKARLETIL